MSTAPIYSLSVEDVFKTLETSSEGLSTEDASSRLSLYGRNILSEQPRDPVWIKFALQLFHPLVGILAAIALIFSIRGDFALAGVIFVLAVANSAFSVWREYRAEQAVKKLQEILPVYTRVLRDNEESSVLASEVTPGDVLVLAEGDNIPADARIIEEYGLRVNNSTLTGEAIATRKAAEPSTQRDISELEQPNLIFAGTSVASGTGRAVVFSTGMLTQFGRLTHLTQSIEDEPSPFQLELRKLTLIITIVAICIALLVVAVGLTQLEEYQPDEIIILALGILVAAIPEGLPATLTLSLAMAVQRLAQKGVLAKKLNTVETLGTVSVICTDKSGTLTQNQMTVREIWVAGQKLKLSGVGYEPIGKFQPEPEDQPWEEDLMELLDAASCCNNARIHPPTPEHPTWSSLGDQTEAAMKVAALKARINEKALGILFPRVHEIPFDARRKRMTTIHREIDHEVAFTKGAPREVLQLCTHIIINGECVELDNAMRKEIMDANDKYARQALRVLAVARRKLPLAASPYTPENIERELIFLGLMAMMDPPRPEVEHAVQTCRDAGIRIVMITGDYGLTAESLARRVGMLTTSRARIITGAELEEMSDIEIQKALEEEVLFARMAPEHKMRMVSAFQSRGDVVAVTGDGVNDAPALRKADVGVAMGIVGTDVAKEAADIILTNDNFGAIVAAIEEGRGVFDNIRKFITYIFSSNVPEVFPFLVTALSPAIPLALTVRQILAIDLGTDFFPAIALGMEQPEPDVMKKPPRKKNQPLIDNGLLTRAFLWLGMIEATLCYLGFFAVYYFSGHMGASGIADILIKIPHIDILKLHLSREEAAIMAVTVFHAGVVIAQIGNAFACRSETARGRHLGWGSNRFLLLAIALEIVGILTIVYIEPFASIFGHKPIPWQYWLGIGFYGLILYSLEWIRKQIARRTHVPTIATN